MKIARCPQGWAGNWEKVVGDGVMALSVPFTVAWKAAGMAVMVGMEVTPIAPEILCVFQKAI